MTKDNLESKVKKFGDLKDRSYNYINAEIFGETASAIGSYLGAQIGENFFSGSSRFFNVLSGGIAGDYLFNTIFAGGYFYSKYKDEYKGLDGKARLAKDLFNFHIRSLPATALSYVAYAPITAVGLSFGLAAGPAAAAASILSSALYVAGSYLSNMGYLKQLGEKQPDSHLSPASPKAPNSSASKNAA